MAHTHIDASTRMLTRRELLGTTAMAAAAQT